MPKAAVPRSGVPREGLGTVQAGVSGDGVQAASTTPPIMVFAAVAARSASDAAGVAVGAGLPATVADAAAPVRAGTGDAVPAPSSPAPAHAARARAIPASRATNAGLNAIPAMSITPSDDSDLPAPNLPRHLRDPASWTNLLVALPNRLTGGFYADGPAVCKRKSALCLGSLVELRWISLKPSSSCCMIGESPFAYSKADGSP